MSTVDEYFRIASSLNLQQRSEFLEALSESVRLQVVRLLETKNQTPADVCDADTISPANSDRSGLKNPVKIEDLPTLAPAKGTRAANDSTINPSTADRNSQTETFGEYELLEEIARGGMGVVYRARHRQLNREVALKMILSGQFASPEAVARFHLEAEAAANLDHPGITPIYEIGEENGQPFFAMKLIEGGSVEDSIAKYETDPRKSAQLLADVSRAIHHAHQRGILHRDLKPNNILLDEQQHPLVTDFGLAKMSDRNSDHTRTGAVMGTPAYMAPEQASGHKNVTTSADIYSLGAILYRLLTGQPTYQAKNALDIIIKLLDEDPKPPRQIKPSIPVDLESICLKCLARDPRERYHSAADLADDLDRWLVGEPVSVRPASASTLAGIWMRQHMQMAGGAAIVGSITGLLLALMIYIAAFSSNFAFAAATYERFFPSLDKPFMAINWSSPDWTFPVALIIWPLLVALCGFFVVVVAKPNSRNAAASTGMIAGVFCGGLMGMMGTIGPLVTFTVGKTAPDIQILADAAYGSDAVAKNARQTLLNRYPDLLNVDETDRGQVIRQKIASDITLGLPTGLWSGMAVFLFAVPLVVLGSTYAWKLCKETPGLLAALWRYLDVSFACSLLLTFILLLTVVQSLGAGLFVPEIPVRTLTIGSLALGLVAALKHWNWMVRIPIHVFWIGFVCLYVQNNFQAMQGDQLANQAIVAGDYARAAEYLELSLGAHPDNEMARLRAGIFRAQMGDVAAYRRHCLQMIKRFADTPLPTVAERTAKLCLLRPDGLDDLSPAIELSRRALELGEEGDMLNWYFLTQGLAEYRAGDPQAAFKVLEKIDREYSLVINGTADMVKGMALIQSGNADEARSLIEASDKWFRHGWQEFVSDQGKIESCHDHIFYELLHEQAKGLLVKGPSRPAQQ